MLPRLLLLLLVLGSSLIVNSQNNSDAQTEKDQIFELTQLADIALIELDFKESLRLSREALQRAIKIKDDYLIATAYNTIAGCYDELGEVEKAITYYNKGLEFANKTNNDDIKNWLYNNLGNMYAFEKNQYDIGLKYYKKSLEYSEKAKDTAQILFTKLNMSWSYFDSDKYEEGAPYLQYVNKHFDRHGRNYLEGAHNLLNAMYQGHLGNKVAAEQFYNSAIDSATEAGEFSDLAATYKHYATFLSKNEQHKRAFEFLMLYDKLKEKIYGDEKIDIASSEGLNLELDEYKRVLARIEAENEVQALSIQKSQIIVILFVITLLALLLLTYILFKSNMFRKNVNAELISKNRELLVARDQAFEAAKLKTQFVSTISHELRTPLYGVVGITNMLSDEHKELADSPHLNSLKFSAKYLLSLVNDILQINKIEENRVELEQMTFNLSDELHNVVDSLQFIATNNNNQIFLEVDPSIPEFLIGDKLRLAQIFMNLVSNALKFTTNGTVHLEAKQLETKSGYHKIYFSITDTGVGIAKEFQDKIFEKFVQIDRKESDYQGTGLGLAIVKKLIELFGSEIHVESKEGAGTKFYFTLELEHNLKRTQEIINALEVDLTSAEIFHILVVEDNKINQMVTKKILSNNNISCELVDDGVKAIELFKTGDSQFDLILMDINMPELNGFETTKALRDLGVKIPVIALTAYDKIEIAEEAIAAGINDIVVKPFEPVKLFKTIAAQINISRN